MRSVRKQISVLCVLALLGGLFSACGPTETRRATGEYIDDTALNARVKTALLRDDVVGGFDVSTTTYDRVVQLSGFVDNEDQRERAGEIAAEIEGIEEVENNISLTDRTTQYGEARHRDDDEDEDDDDEEAIEDEPQEDEWQEESDRAPVRR